VAASGIRQDFPATERFSGQVFHVVMEDGHC
jgi:hypothetical protein